MSPFLQFRLWTPRHPVTARRPSAGDGAPGTSGADIPSTAWRRVVRQFDCNKLLQLDAGFPDPPRRCILQRPSIGSVDLAKASDMKPGIMRRVADKMRRTPHVLREWIMAPSVSKPASEMGRVTDEKGPSWRDRHPRCPELKTFPPAGGFMHLL